MAAKEFPLSVVIRAIDRVTAPMRGIQSRILNFDRGLRGSLGKMSDRLGLNVLGAAAGKFGSAVGDLGARVARLTAGITALGGAAVAASYALIQSFADTTGAINDTSTAIGVSAEALQEWRYAAKQNGVETELLDNSLMILGKNLGKAFKGKGPAELLQAMHVKLRNANGSFKTTDQLLPQIADGLAKIQNPALRATAAAELFGKGGVKLLPMLKDGSKGLQDYARRARELGIVLSNEVVAQGDDFGDKLDDMKDSLFGVRNTIGTALLPVLTELVDQFTGFIVNNRGKIQAWAEEFARDLPGNIEKIRDLFSELKDKLQPVIDGFQWLTDKIGPANTAILIVAGSIAVFLVPALYAATTAFYALGVALLTTPIGWFLLAVSGIAAIALLIYKNWGPITEFFGTWWQSIKDVFSVVVDYFKGIWAGVHDSFKTSFIDGVIATWNALNPVNLIVHAFSELGPRILAAVAPFQQKLHDWFGGIIPDWAENLMGINTAAGAAPVGAARAGANASAAQNGNVRVQVDLNNLPPGSRVKTDQRGQSQFELNQGFAF